MNKREKILAVAAAAVLGTGVLYLLVDRAVVRPARRLTDQAEALRRDNRRRKLENLRLSRRRRQFAELRDRTFDDNLLRASVRAISYINLLRKQAGLSQEQLSVTPFTRSGTVNTFGEVGCTIRARSSLERMIHFLYLLQQDPHLHRVTNLEIAPEADGRNFRYTLRYSSPVFDRAPPVPIPPPTTQPVELASLNDPARAAYNVIQERNFFRPYVAPVVARRPEPLPPPQWPRRRQPPPAESYFDRLVVTGLPSRAGKPEVLLSVPGQDAPKVYKVGDKLPIGRIAMVDYRVLPMPDNPKILSSSRLILKIGKDYWAVEAGQRLGQRRILRPAELPPELRAKLQSRGKSASTGRPARKS